ncbi:MFS transporter [Microdochium bolleyi]|uniref:MFS transporter n=1 Tax=Microdochium bolleyi TaxID=196109 RepID=A0A136IR56_9PEZI|nr:MFS transporter [Microdochium bolleyi]
MANEAALSKAPSVGLGDSDDLKRTVTTLTGTDVDEGEVFLRENDFSPDYLQHLLSDQQEVKKLMRRVDWRLLPLLCGTFMLVYIDKQSMSYAAVFDLFTDTKINTAQYGWFTSIFYLAYLVAEYPLSALAQRTRMAKVVSACVICWGAVLAGTAAANNFAGLAACRFLLGAFEAAITPCFMMIVSMWYTRDEQPLRAGIFYAANGAGSILGGLLSYGLGQIKGFSVWRIIFLFCGGITILWGFVLFWFLPDDIISARQFSLQDRATLVARGKLGRTGILNKTIKMYQIRETFMDPQIWLLTLFTLLNEIINGGFANFGKLIIKGLVGGDSLKATALGIPMGAFQLVWIISGTYMASRFRNCRTYIMMIYLIPTIIGISLMWQLDNKSQWQGVLMGYYICGSYVCSLVMALQLPASNVAGYTKRVTSTALVFSAYCIGNVIGPHSFLDSEAPKWPTGCKVGLACCVSQVAVAGCLRALLVYRNKKRDEAEAALGAHANREGGNGDDQDAVDEASNDLTDFENPKFRYSL